ncbi:MAG TPA: cytochrome b [Paraburkholderia sp.]|jgi:cytochrome b561|nr:cytochrome b [Paraburkholderia sp.]
MRSPVSARYDLVARLLHWLIAALVAAQFVIAWVMPDVGRNTQPVGAIAWHLGVGSALLVAMACRIIWRISHRPPATELPATMRIASSLTHGALYALLVIVPVLGWSNASSRGWQVAAAGVAPLPALSATGSRFGHAMGDVHSVLAWVLLGIVCLHVGAALLHRFVFRDGVLQRMTLW